MTLERIRPGQWNSRAVLHGDMVYLSGIVADDKSLPIAGQTQQVLEKIDGVLAEAGTDKSKILAVTVYMADIAEKDALNEVYMAWMDASILSTRTCIGAALTPGTRVEITVTATRAE
ncbi:MAG: RidA family protein [Alphaproteobacteria bacterium]